MRRSIREGRPGFSLRIAKPSLMVQQYHTVAAAVKGLGEVDSSPAMAKAIVGARPSHAVARGLRSILVGQDPFDAQILWHKMVEGHHLLWPGRRRPTGPSPAWT